jgi:hypothetical protein
MDYRVPERRGTPPPATFPLVAAYMDRLMKLGCVHQPTAQRFAEVLNLLRPPESLLTPGILCRALAVRQPPQAPAEDRVTDSVAV